MTTIIACAVDGAVHMAADSLTNVYDRPVHGCRKIVRVDLGQSGSGLLGVAGDAAIVTCVGDATAALFEIPAGATPDAVAVSVAKIVTAKAVAAGVTADAGRMDSTLLLGHAGRLWTITHHQAIAHPSGMAAIGSGEGPAMGALTVLLAADTAPVEAVARAADIAITLDRHSGAPVQVESLAP